MKELITKDALASAIGCARIGTARWIPNMVFILMGIPGVGKSETARRLHERHGLTALASEAVTLALFGRVSGLPMQNYAYSASIFRLAAKSLVHEGHTMVLDATHLKREYRDQVRSLLGGLAGLRLLHIHCEPELAFDRASGRAEEMQPLDPSTRMQRGTFEMLHTLYEPPGEDERAATFLSDATLPDKIDQFMAWTVRT